MRTLCVSFILFFLLSCKTDKNLENKIDIDFDAEIERLEGKVLMSENGEWFVIKDGFRWRAMSETATTDYLNSIKDGQNHVEKNIQQIILDQFPLAGEILPNVEFQRK